MLAMWFRRDLIVFQRINGSGFMDESHTGIASTDWKPNRRFDFCETNSEEEKKEFAKREQKGVEWNALRQGLGKAWGGELGQTGQQNVNSTNPATPSPPCSSLPRSKVFCDDNLVYTLVPHCWLGRRSYKVSDSINLLKVV